MGNCKIILIYIKNITENDLILTIKMSYFFRPIISFLFLSFISIIFFCNNNLRREKQLYESYNCSQPPTLKVGDTLIVNLERVLGAGKNWKLKNDTLNMQGIIFQKKGITKDNYSKEGSSSLISFVFIMKNKTNGILYFEYGSLWKKKFKPDETCEIKFKVD